MFKLTVFMVLCLLSSTLLYGQQETIIQLDEQPPFKKPGWNSISLQLPNEPGDEPNDQAFVLKIDLVGDRGIVRLPKTKKYPKAGQELSIQVGKYNPYRDEINVVADYKDFQEEPIDFVGKLISKFGVDLAPPAAPETEKEEEKENTNPAEERDDEVTPESINYVKDQLAVFYHRAYHASYINVDSLQKAITEIEEFIADFLDIPQVNKTAIIEAGKRLLGDAQEAQNDLARIAELYEKIISYNRINSLSISLEEADQVEVSFPWEHYGNLLSKTAYPKKILQLRGGLGFNTSIGLIATPLQNHTYDVKRVEAEDTSADSENMSTTEKDSLIRTDRSRISAGLALMGNWYFRFGLGNNIQHAGFTVGYGLSDEFNGFYLLGGSWIIGKKNRFILTAGIAGGKVDRLSAKLSEGQLFDPSENTSVATQKDFHTDFFLGIALPLGK